jgi:hypothetical protein
VIFETRPRGRATIALGCLLGLTASVSLSKPQLMDTDVRYWLADTFSEDTATVTTKVPRGFRVRSSLPELTYKRGQRLLLGAQYDFGTGESDFTSEFEIRVHFVKLAAPLDVATAKADDLDRALTFALGHPVKGPESPQPTEQSIRGTEWIHYDNTTDITYGQTREAYATVLDSTTILVITAWYGPHLRKDPKWFDSRRQILRIVCDNTRITHQ